MTNTIDNIQQKIGANVSLSKESKTGLLGLLTVLKHEVNELSKTNTEQAESISGFVERSTREVMRLEKNPDLIKHAIEGLAASVKGFEATRPILTENVNYIVNALANMGI
jgi:hypothetical protein